MSWNLTLSGLHTHIHLTFSRVEKAIFYLLGSTTSDLHNLDWRLIMESGLYENTSDVESHVDVVFLIIQ